MRRSAKPAKIEAKRPVGCASHRNEGPEVRNLEERLAEALKCEAETLDQQNATVQLLRTRNRELAVTRIPEARAMDDQLSERIERDALAQRREAVMRSIAVWIGAVLMAGGLSSASAISLGRADGPAVPRSSSGVTEDAAGKQTHGSEAVRPAEGEPTPTPRARYVRERGLQQQIKPGLLRGGALSPGDRYAAPTPSLTLIANAVRLKFKSVTTVLTAPPNLPVTAPVEISVGYYSSAGNRRITQNYAVATGNRILYNDVEGDGNPRRLRLDITLRELQPGGPSFAFSLPVDLDPLYDVGIGALRFSLDHDCDLVGQSEISLLWYAPDDQPHFASFSIKGSRTTWTHITAFAWSQSEVSAQADLHEPSISFTELDPGFSFDPNPAPLKVKLLPGKTQNFDYFLNEGSIKPRPDFVDRGKCQARVTYQITRVLRRYPHL